MDEEEEEEDEAAAEEAKEASEQIYIGMAERYKWAEDEDGMGSREKVQPGKR